MQRTDAPYAVSILIGALLGVGLFFILAPRLEPPPLIAVPSDQTDPGMTSRPTVAETEGRRPDSPRTIVPGSPKPPTQTRPDRSGSGQQDRRVVPVRPVNLLRSATPLRPATPLRTPGFLATTTGERTGVEVVQSTPRPTLPSSGIAQAPTPSPYAQGRRYIIQVGPVADRDRATEIVRQLAFAGFDAGVTSREEPGPPHFQVISETVPLGVAERRVIALTHLGFRPQLRTLAGGFAQLLFGAFASQREAELLAERVRITGYAFAAVVREGGTVYVITLGPHRKDTVETILFRMQFRWMLPVTVSLAN